ncbi:MAG: imelysin family protein [Pseudomonadota bacterium]
MARARAVSAAPVAACWPVLALCALAVFGGAAGCARDAAARERRRGAVQEAMKQVLSRRLAEWRTAAESLQRAAPVPAGRGWDTVADAQSLAAMRGEWARGRTAYERIEGAVAPLFPESDVATDSRYEGFLVKLGSVGDPAPFDGQGVVGMHAIERILWADAIPPEVARFERALPGYRSPAFPADAAQARAFKNDLVGRLVDDIRTLGAQLAPLELDVAFAFRGLFDLAVEQKEKVVKAATGEEESRYAQATMRDLRANLNGCREVYEIFRPWVLGTRGGDAVDASVTAAFGRVEVAYGAVPGDAFPQPPATWSALQPSVGDRATAFGRLYTTVERETDTDVPGSLVAALATVAAHLELPAALLR